MACKDNNTQTDSNTGDIAIGYQHAPYVVISGHTLHCECNKERHHPYSIYREGPCNEEVSSSSPRGPHEMARLLYQASSSI
ncbi:hypothetical protein J4Q44_G00084240 [Coregonus suidteri]|uniref:Uncharacterized protein n=1 Tax=Coregonus suidteri TaxID=861788 RepID=A0AAN8LYX0_9TELE